jgi:microcystin-dependent protein
VTKEYVAVAQNGPTTSNVTRPYQDVNYTCWKPITLFMTDYVYPVGSIYMTTSATNPGTIFGGTWAKIENRFLIGASGTYSVGTTGGSTTQTLTTTNMPSHTHTVTTGNSTNTPTITIAAKTVTANTGNQSQPHTHSVTFPAKTFSNATNSTGAHTHSRGSMNITGTFDANDLTDDKSKPSVTGAFGYSRSSLIRESEDGTSNPGYKITFDASKSWSGSTSSAGNHQHSVTIPATSMTVGNNSASHTHSVSLTVPSQTVNVASYTHDHSVTVGNTGGGSAFSIVPPYYAVYIWRRTA